MDSIYLPVGDGVTGAQQLDFLQTQYYATSDSQTKAAIDTAMQGLGNAPVGSAATSLPSAKSNLLSKIDSLISGSALPDTSKTAGEQITTTVSDPINAQLSKVGDWFKRYGSDLLAIVIGLIFLIAGIYVYRSN